MLSLVRATMYSRSLDLDTSIYSLTAPSVAENVAILQLPGGAWGSMVILLKAKGVLGVLIPVSRITGLLKAGAALQGMDYLA